jgi:cytochrome oxidase Cu insertion factor (SCO1/SenC/PrrC family)
VKIKPLAGAFAAGVAVAALGWLLWRQAFVEPPERAAAELMDVVMWGKEPIGGPFSLIDHNGQPRTDADFRGKLLLIYFGFTYCSDACPIDLQSVAGALDKLGPASEAVQPLFITVDPQKDTPEQLKRYVALFHPRLIGLTGSFPQIRAVERAYKVYAGKSDPSKEADPNIDHSSFVYLIDAAGKYIGFFPPGTSADRMVEVIGNELARQRAPSRAAAGPPEGTK